MGNYSNDPGVRLAESVAKRYVGVRMQQAVPVLDADWNLLEDLRRREFETMGAWFIGDGIPAGDDGFHILAGGQPNDFGIRAGLCIVNGKLTENGADTSYATQPNFASPDVDPALAALTTPPADKSFIVYLDVWEHEVDSQVDPALVDARIGLETAIRLKRDWVVRVARVPEDLGIFDNPPPAGHAYLKLAQINRKAANANISTAIIIDLRETQLTINRKIQVRNNAGAIVVDNARFTLMLKSTRDNAHAFSNYLTNVLNKPNQNFTAGEVLGLQAIEVISHAAEAGLALVNARSIANPGALQYLFQLYDAENNFFNVWKQTVLQVGGTPKKYASFNLILTRLDQRLHQPVVGQLTGLQPALLAGDLAAAVTTQEEIARLIGTAGNAQVPHGSIQVLLSNSPAGNLTNGQVARFEFKVKSATTQPDTYSVSVLPQAGWPRRVVDAVGNPVPNNKVQIGASPSVTSVFIDVNVQAGSSGLQLEVSSDSNPIEIEQLSNSFTLTEGQPAPFGEDKLLVARVGAPPSNATIDPLTGTIVVNKLAKCGFFIALTNNTGQNGSFAVTLQKSDEVVPGSWDAAYKGSTPLPINTGATSQNQAVEVTPLSATAQSFTLQLIATANIGGSTVTGQLTLVFAQSTS